MDSRTGVVFIILGATFTGFFLISFLCMFSSMLPKHYIK